jgi:nucleoside-diphosphate-sugar epimerase
MLGWTPSVSLDDGLAQTIDYFEQVLSATVGSGSC